MPKKMRQLALRCALSAKASDGEMKILEKLKLEEPRTKNMVEILAALDTISSTLIVTGEPEDNVVKSVRNLPKTKIITASLLNVIDVLSFKILLITEEAVRKAERLWGQRISLEESHASL
jgi:large subunit ribosomal protein L4